MVGDGAIIAAGAVVTHDVPARSIVAGVPAAVIGWRFDQTTRDAYLGLSWWEWGDDRIRACKELFKAGEAWPEFVSGLELDKEGVR